MRDADLNLLIALDALLSEGGVAGAARRLNLSASAVSRSLARLRAATGDPLLVRAGRALAPTPYAAELRERVRRLAEDVTAVLGPSSATFDAAAIDRTFTIRANSAFVEAFAPRLILTAIEAAPKIRLRFAPKADKDPRYLREGISDLEIGVASSVAPEIRVQTLYRDLFVGAARAGHPLLTDGEITPERYAACRHVVVSRRGAEEGPVDTALRALGLKRRVVAVTADFRSAIEIASRSDLIALVSHSWLDALDPATRDAERPIRGFALPVSTPQITVSLAWHPRMEADPAHRWLRQLVRHVCRPRTQDRGGRRDEVGRGDVLKG